MKDYKISRKNKMAYKVQGLQLGFKKKFVKIVNTKCT